MSNLPLNIPYLMQRLRPTAKYVMHGRSYGDIEWLDNDQHIPSLVDLENEFIRIQGLENAHKNKSERIVALEKEGVHEILERAKGEAKHKVQVIHIEHEAERARMLKEIDDKRETLANELRLERDDKLKAMSINIDMLRRVMASELKKRELVLLNLAVNSAVKKANISRKVELPTKEEMINAIRGGRKSIEEMAARIKLADKK